MKRAIVTGTGGQIGSDLAPALVQAGAEIRLLDYLKPNLVSGSEMLQSAFGDDKRWSTEWWVQADANDRTTIRRLFKEFRPDVVFHLVALLSATSEKSPSWAWHVNLGSLNVIVDILLELQGDDPSYRPTLVWPSSIAAYGVPIPGFAGGLPGGKVPEDFPMQPRTMYGATKLAGEALGSYYAAKSLYQPARTGPRDAVAAPRPTLDFRSLRFPGLLSATPPGGGSSDYANAIYFKAAGHPIAPIFVSRETRMPFLHMSDAVDALLALATARESALTRRIYNLSGFAPSVEELIASVRRHQPDFDVESVPDYRQAIVDSWPDDMEDASARRDWGFAPKFDLDACTDDLIPAIARHYPPGPPAPPAGQ